MQKSLSCRNEAFCQDMGGRSGAAGLCWEHETGGHAEAAEAKQGGAGL